MKKRIHFHASDALMLVALVATAALCSSFTVAVKNTDAATFGQTAWATLQNYSFHKLTFWQKAALSVGALGTSAYAVRRFHRWHGGGVGCLGVLGGIILIALIIALLPILLVVGLVMLILGMPFHWDRWGYREHRQHREHRLHR
jgi:hypothetical protein